MINLFRTLTVTFATMAFASTGFTADEEKPKADRPDRPAAGEGGRGQRMNPEERLKMMTERLSLTQEQQDKIKGIMAENREKNAEAMRKLREDSSLTPEQRREKAREIFKAERDAIA